MESVARGEEGTSSTGASGDAQCFSGGDASDGEVGVECAKLPRGCADVTGDPSEGFVAACAVGGEGSIGSGSEAERRNAEGGVCGESFGRGERFGAMLSSERADLVGDLAIFLFGAEGGEGVVGGEIFFLKFFGEGGLMVFCESGSVGLEECVQGDLVAFGDTVGGFAFLCRVDLDGGSGALVFFEGLFDGGDPCDGEAQGKVRRDGVIGSREEFAQHGVVEVECFFREFCGVEEIFKPEGFGQEDFAKVDGFLGFVAKDALIVVDQECGREEFGVKVSSVESEATVS